MNRPPAKNLRRHDRLFGKWAIRESPLRVGSALIALAEPFILKGGEGKRPDGRITSL